MGKKKELDRLIEKQADRERESKIDKARRK